MNKARSSFVPTVLLLAMVSVGCGQTSSDDHSGSGGSSDHESGRSSSVSGSAGSSGSGGATSESSGSRATAGQRSVTGGRSSSFSNGGGGSNTSSVQGGQSGGTSGTIVGSSSERADAGGAGTGGSSAMSDAGRTLPKDAGAPAGDAASIPPLPVRQDAGVSFWAAAAYASNCKPPAIGGRAQDDGHHKPGANCMTSGCHLNPKKAEHHAGTDCRGSGCHANGSPDGSGAPAFLFGGTAYHAATLVAEVAAEVGVKAGTASYTACSASNGNFWVVAPSGKTSLTWTGTSIRLRNANGEAPMMTTPAAGCNATACHTGTLKITAP